MRLCKKFTAFFSVLLVLSMLSTLSVLNVHATTATFGHTTIGANKIAAGNSPAYLLCGYRAGALTCVNITDSVSVPVTVKSNVASVTVNAVLAAPTIAPSRSTVDQGQTSVLSNSTVISTGTGPYLYQWFEMAPGASAYSAIGGATSTSYSFVTSVSTTAGVWRFELNVTDATGAVVTSNAVSVTVNPVLSVNISPTSVTLHAGQSQTFNSTVSGGTSPYLYQWYLNGSVSGATSANWTLVTSSAGYCTVYVEVTDGVSAQAKSNTAAVTVPAIPEFPSYLLLPLFMLATLLAAIVLKRKRNARE